MRLLWGEKGRVRPSALRRARPSQLPAKSFVTSLFTYFSKVGSTVLSTPFSSVRFLLRLCTACVFRSCSRLSQLPQKRVHASLWWLGSQVHRGRHCGHQLDLSHRVYVFDMQGFVVVVFINRVKQIIVLVSLWVLLLTLALPHSHKVRRSFLAS